eukprot:1175723-Prorocentrum_minimum.AAC.2
MHSVLPLVAHPGPLHQREVAHVLPAASAGAAPVDLLLWKRHRLPREGHSAGGGGEIATAVCSVAPLVLLHEACHRLVHQGVVRAPSRGGSLIVLVIIGHVLLLQGVVAADARAERVLAVQVERVALTKGSESK